jgi:GNAT superfamily N-acetyltransferase
MNIRSATTDEGPNAIATIVAAFITDPLARFAWPKACEYLSAMPTTVAAFVESSFQNGTAYVIDDFAGAALWMPPGVFPNGDALEQAFRDTTDAARVDDVLGTFDRMAQSHPQGPHWYLGMIGVDPNAQGRGLGAELMQHALARCDAEGAIAYLEASSPRNVPLYLRHGFEIIGEVQVGKAPPLFPMVRNPCIPMRQ